MMFTSGSYSRETNMRKSSLEWPRGRNWRINSGDKICRHGYITSLLGALLYLWIDAVKFESRGPVCTYYMTIYSEI